MAEHSLGVIINVLVMHFSVYSETIRTITATHQRTPKLPGDSSQDYMYMQELLGGVLNPTLATTFDDGRLTTEG